MSQTQPLSLLDDITQRLGAMSPEDAESVKRDALEATADMVWVPNPGPQTEAFFCQADELFYGGEAGGGKTDLLMGLSLTAHQASLVMRRTNPETKKLVERYVEAVGHDNGLNRSAPANWRLGDRSIDIAGCQLETDKQKWKGAAHDLKAFDEITDFTESQYEFIIGWNRSVIPGQRCRVVGAGNPPTQPEGLWVIARWAAWLDPRHPNPAKPGELRWYTRDENGIEIEVDGPGPHRIGDRMQAARSRTFIPAHLSDNPDLSATDYAANLDAMPEELREAYRDGKFNRALRDSPMQCIPTAWVLTAQDRWIDQLPEDVPMCAMGVDVAQGGPDNTVLAPRYDGYYPELIVKPGKDTPDGKSVFGFIMGERRDKALIVVDLGGGYGGATFEKLKDNDIKCQGYKGGSDSLKRTKDKQFSFFNRRTEAYWMFREALDPSQEGGSHIMLPPDPGLIADLTAPWFEDESKVIKLETKKALVKRLGRSPDKGDAVVMAWTGGEKIWNIQGGKFKKNHVPKVILGHQNMKKRRR